MFALSGSSGKGHGTENTHEEETLSWHSRTGTGGKKKAEKLARKT